MRLLQEARPGAARARRGRHRAARARRRAVQAEVDADLGRPDAEGSSVAYFCAEFGVHRSLPIYSGGLGALAGDILKEASDLAVPLIAVGLMYRQGYFRQRIDAGGWQHEYWVDTDPERLPAALVRGDDGEPLTITVPVRDMEVVAQIWRVDVGRVALYLLDTERPENSHLARWITSRLYIGDPDARPRPVRAARRGRRARARGAGHRARAAAPQRGPRAPSSRWRRRAPTAARSRTASRPSRRRTVFTTHTPVPAGNDTYPAAQVAEALDRPHDGAWASRPTRSSGSAAPGPDDAGEPFGVSQFALRTSRAANGVSRRHGEVARGMWKDLWPGRELDDVPIGHVTNGVHVPTWLGGPMREPARPPPRRRLAASRRRPGDLGARPRRPRRGAVGGPQRAARGVRRLRAREEHRRPPRPRRAARLRRGRRPRVRSRRR